MSQGSEDTGRGLLQRTLRGNLTWHCLFKHLRSEEELKLKNLLLAGINLIFFKGMIFLDSVVAKGNNEIGSQRPHVKSCTVGEFSNLLIPR